MTSATLPSNPVGSESSKDLLRLKLKKPKSWNWEISTSKSAAFIDFPRILLYDNHGNLLADIQEADCVVNNRKPFLAEKSERVRRSKSSCSEGLQKYESEREGASSICRSTSGLSENENTNSDKSNKSRSLSQHSCSRESEIPVFIYSAKGLIRRNLKDKEFDEIRDTQMKNQFNEEERSLKTGSHLENRCNECGSTCKFSNRNSTNNEFQSIDIENESIQYCSAEEAHNFNRHNEIVESDFSDSKSSTFMNSNNNLYYKSSDRYNNSKRYSRSNSVSIHSMPSSCSICSAYLSMEEINNGDGASYIKGGEKYNENIAVGDMKNCNGNEFEILMVKRKGTLGFTLRKEDNLNSGHWVHSLVRAPATTDGRIRPGDKIVAVNDVPLGSMTHEEAIIFLRQTNDSVKLRIQRMNISETLLSTNLSNVEEIHRFPYLRPEALSFLNEISQRKRK